MSPARVLIAPDKFAGTLDAAEAGAAIAEGWRRARPHDVLRILPLADGGPGTLEALAATGAGHRHATSTTDPLGRPITSHWWETTDGTAVVEVAAVCGLHLLDEREHDPLRASSAGLGMLLAAVRRAGVHRIVVGLGGTATVDGGWGALHELGARFTAEDGRALVPGEVTALQRLASVTSFPERLPALQLASDVRNPLLGPNGAAHVFGPQKGADAAAVRELEMALTRLADVAERDLSGGPWRHIAGAGAAGGMGFGLLAWGGAQVVSGAELVGQAVGLEAAVANADVVVTGEGGLDAQTAQGKVPEHVRTLARAAGRQILVVAGRIDSDAALAYDDHAELGPDGMTWPQQRCRDAGEAIAARWSGASR